jgi:hypothetical protein
MTPLNAKSCFDRQTSCSNLGRLSLKSLLNASLETLIKLRNLRKRLIRCSKSRLNQDANIRSKLRTDNIQKTLILSLWSPQFVRTMILIPLAQANDVICWGTLG